MQSHCLSGFIVVHSVRKWDVSKAFALQISLSPAFFFFCFLKCYVETRRNDLTSEQPLLQAMRNLMEQGFKGCLVPAAAGHPEKQSLCHRAAGFQSALLVTELLGYLSADSSAARASLRRWALQYPSLLQIYLFVRIYFCKIPLN